MNILEETIRWAEAHGIDVPGFNPDGTTTIEATINELAAAEAALIEQFRLALASWQQGLLTQEDRQRYEVARAKLFSGQATFAQQVNSGRVWSMLQSLGVTRRIPLPTLAPSLPPGAPSVLQGPDGRAAPGLGALQIPAAAAWAGAVAAILVVGYFISIGIDALSAGFQARVNSETHVAVMAARISVYQACLSSGDGDLQECLNAARMLVEQPPPGVGTSNTKKLVMYVAGGLLLGGLGYIGFRYWSNRAATAGERAGRGTAGLRGPGGPKRLKSMDDSYPSRYFLEV